MKITILIAIMTTHFVALTQDKSTVSGFVKDLTSGEPIIGAKVYCSETKQGTITNEYGFYSLTLYNDTIKIQFSSIGYSPQDSTILVSSDINISIELLSNNQLNTVVVYGQEQIEDKTQMGEISLPMNMVQKLPVLLGETDIIKVLQLYPGVQSGNEGSSGMYVRGGGADQNLILLDGVPVYNVSHLFGFFSVFNSESINNVTMIKGGFPARYGGRQSSVLDIRMKEGNSKNFQGSVNIGLISSKFTLEGPIKKDKTSFIISGRRTYMDLLANLARSKKDTPLNNDSTSMKTGYYFWDLNAKINHKFSDNSRLYVSGYFGLDRFYNQQGFSYSSGGVVSKQETNNKLQWGNAIGSIRWNRVINPKLFLNVSANYSQYQFLVGFDIKTLSGANEEKIGFSYSSGIRDWTGKVDFNYHPNSIHTIKFGGGNTYHTFTPGVNQFITSGNTSLDSVSSTNKLFSHEHWLYLEDDFEITKKLKVNLGLHLAGFLTQDKWFPSIQPRISARYLINANSSLKLSYSRMNQYLHLLTNPTIGLPTDLWVPVTKTVRPQFSDQIAFGYFQTLPIGFQFSAETYYKSMNNLIEYKEGASFFSASADWQDKVVTGKGNSYGFEFLFEKKTGKTTGWIGYTLSWNNRQFEDLNFGNPFPYTYDRRHDIGVAITHKFSDKFDLGVVWVYGTGNATTLALQTYNGIDGSTYTGQNPMVEIEYLDSRNNYRMPSYHRLDIGLNFNKQRKYYYRTWQLGFYNLYSRQNPFMLYFDLNDKGQKVLKQLSLFPIIPSISYSLKF
ncbi:TonB-dependent receptor [Paracrocinitomix mangrovi]|uniref:TonB-dependent receptor n=1 Tax=Paracrocinitomix mangrovi TaxID=2862509 RepID=UPI001C8E56F1|nr:TonB-dependent receptor [Paracrocinitomix mangrovi]UKN02257.1 TonB-dependent receptor [Paracrocinitomix mangrovi]